MKPVFTYPFWCDTVKEIEALANRHGINTVGLSTNGIVERIWNLDHTCKTRPDVKTAAALSKTIAPTG